MFSAKAETLETDTLTGIADYLIAPRRAYLATPLLCTVEAKRDDFEKGRVQCLAEMAACRWNNKQSQLDIDIYGIVSNGQVWRFYKLTITIELTPEQEAHLAEVAQRACTNHIYDE